MLKCSDNGQVELSEVVTTTKQSISVELFWGPDGLLRMRRRLVNAKMGRKDTSLVEELTGVTRRQQKWGITRVTVKSHAQICGCISIDFYVLLTNFASIFPRAGTT